MSKAENVRTETLQLCVFLPIRRISKMRDGVWRPMADKLASQYSLIEQYEAQGHDQAVVAARKLSCAWNLTTGFNTVRRKLSASHRISNAKGTDECYFMRTQMQSPLVFLPIALCIILVVAYDMQRDLVQSVRE